MNRLSITPVKRVKIARQDSAAALAPVVELSNPTVTNVGAVAKVNRGMKRLSPLGSFSVTLDNSAGVAVKNYIINDNTGIIEATSGISSPAKPDSGTVTPSVMEKVIGEGAVAIKAIQYETDTSAAQFAQPFKFWTADMDGQASPEPIDIAAFKRNNAFNPLLLTLEFPEAQVLSWNRTLQVSVKAGETVTLTFIPEGAANRF